MLEDVIRRLAQLGYVVEESDREVVQAYVDKVCAYVKMFCHIQEIPELAKPKIVDRICSEFLYMKYYSGKLTGFDYNPTASKIVLGDTSVAYAYGDGERTPSQRMEAMINKLGENFEKGLVDFRQLAW